MSLSVLKPVSPVPSPSLTSSQRNRIINKRAATEKLEKKKKSTAAESTIASTVLAPTMLMLVICLNVKFARVGATASV